MELENIPQQQKTVPKDANDHCPGVESQQAGKSEACDGCPNQKICASGQANAEDPDMGSIRQKMSQIKHKLLVLSGKGGVGKSTVASQLALMLAHRGFEVGLLDLDICGPSIPRMMGLEGHDVHQSAEGWSPVYVDEDLAVMSIGFLLSKEDDAIIWRGPKKNGLIKQFLMDVSWGELDFLVIDSSLSSHSPAWHLRRAHLHHSVPRARQGRWRSHRDHPADGRHQRRQERSQLLLQDQHPHPRGRRKHGCFRLPPLQRTFVSCRTPLKYSKS